MSLLDHIQQFHFIRPDWLLLLLPAFALFLLLLKRKLTAGQWQDVIDEELLPYALDNAPQKTDRSSLWLVMFAWVIATLALAGPSWEKMPTPVEKNQDALVILLDMSLSMGAQDVKPDRATRAIQKVTDIIRGRKDGLTALLTYSGEAHTVTPLTDDRDTIENLLPAISPFIMPKPGSRPDKAIALAQKLVTDAGINKARLLLITDGIINKDIQRINKVLDPKRFQLSVMTLGTAEGAPVSMPNSGFLRDGQGNIVLPKLDLQPIRQLVSELNVAWQPIRYDDQDWQQLLQPKTTNEAQAEFSGGADSKQFDQWFDQGFWLIFLLLPVTLLLFRRGVLFSWLLLPALVLPAINPAPAWADDTTSTNKPNATQQQAAEQETSFWQNLWQTPDQQGAELLNSDPAAAAQRFENPDWQGVASYQAGDFEAAQRAFADNNSANGRYNYANALAQSGELQAALDAYDEALQQQPGFADAAENRKLVEQALKQQQNQQQQNKDGQPQDSDQNQSGDSSQTQESQQQDSQQQNSQDSQQNPSQSGESQQQNQQNGDPGDQKNGEQGEPQNSSAVNKQQDDAFAEQKAAEQKAQELAEQDQQQDKDGEQQALSEQSQDEQQQSEQQSPSATQQKNSSSEQQSDQSTADSTSMTQQQIQESQLNREEQAAMQQWLNRIPDNPGNLLQRKFLYQYRQQDGGQAEQQEDVLW